MKRVYAIPTLSLFLMACVSEGQQDGTSSSTTVEFIGLKTWTAQMIEDSMAVHAPGVPLASSACAAVLREKLGFPDAAVSFYPAVRKGAESHLVITVIEPQDSGRVRYKTTFPDSLPFRSQWTELVKFFENNNSIFQSTLQSSESDLVPKERQFRDLLRSHGDAAADQLARWTLEHDGNYMNRVIAAAILINFVSSDSTWWVLASALRDPIGPVAGTAEQVLHGFANYQARKVNWTPATESLRYVLDGTNTFVLPGLLRVLAKTEVSPDLAGALLKGGGELVLASLTAEARGAREPAYRFLVQISGRDLGKDPEKWKAWIRSL